MSTLLLLGGQISDEFGLNGLNSGNETEICDKHSLSLYKANVIEVPHLQMISRARISFMESQGWIEEQISISDTFPLKA